jgi:DNA-directed RNA polymerase subunit beta
MVAKIEAFGVKNISLVSIDNTTITAHICNTLVADKTSNREEALFAIYDLIRQGERTTLEAAINMFLRQGFDPAYYDLSAVGRFKMNKRLHIDSGKKPEDERTLSKSDFLAVLKTLTNIIDHKDVIDDIDNLSNRRVRAVGELFEQTFRTGMARIERAVRQGLDPRHHQRHPGGRGPRSDAVCRGAAEARYQQDCQHHAERQCRGGRQRPC